MKKLQVLQLPKTNLDFYLSEHFGRFMETPLLPEIKRWFEAERRYLRKNIKRDSSILEIGCGYGRSIADISDIASRVVGVDLSPLCLSNARKNLAHLKNIEIYKADGRALPFREEDFDFTISMGNTFGSLNGYQNDVLKEMRRVTKSGGRIILGVYSERALPIRIRDYSQSGLHIIRVDPEKKIFTEEGLVTEQFTRNKLEDLFSTVGLDVSIKRLTPITYICDTIKR